MLNKIKSKLLKSMFDALFNKTSNSPTIHGDKTRLHIGNNVSLVNALINLSSGSVFIGNNSKFGHNCMLLTGKHSYGNSPKSNLRTVLEWHGISNYNMFISPNNDKNISILELSDMLEYSSKYFKNIIKKRFEILKLNGKDYISVNKFTDWLQQKDAPILGNDIRIGNNCWIASGAIILGSVSIGDNSVVGAGSVVTKGFPENVLICGNPARIIKQL